MKTAVRSLFFALLCIGVPCIAAQKPNVLLIVSDDQGWPDLGCMGLKPVQTPNLDRLAAEGVRATNFYVTWPACTPSRGSLLTGRFPQRNGLYDMVRNDMTNYGHLFTEHEYAVSPEMTLGLDGRERTLGDLLSTAGYRCGVVGKWDMGQAKRYLPLQRGFQTFYGHGNNGIDYYTHERYGVPSMFRDNARTQEDKGTYATTLFERESKRFIGKAKAQPWFLYLCFNAPHGASSFSSDPKSKKEGVQCPQEYADRFKDSVPDEKLRRYYGAVAAMDESIGKLLAQIDERGETDNTLVMFLSDNGGSGNGGNAPLRGAKSSMWEGGLRVPFIACWPGTLPAGKVTDEFLTTLEVLPTLQAAAGAEWDQGISLDGFDMLPMLQGKVPSPRKSMFWQRRSDKAARVGEWKWLESAKGKGLYHLTEDPSEKNDLSAKMPEKAAELQAAWQAWRKEMDATEPRGPFRDY